MLFKFLYNLIFLLEGVKTEGIIRHEKCNYELNIWDIKKRNEPEALKKKRAGVWNVQTGDNIVACVTKSGSDKSAEVHCPPLEDHGCKSRD